VKEFALWLATTRPSVFIQEQYAWTIPTLQTLHILGIALVMGSVLMINLRVLGWAGKDQSLSQTARRFGPWVIGSLLWMLTTGLLMVIGQPTRELMSFSFRLKMALVAIATVWALIFHRTLRRFDAPSAHLVPAFRRFALVMFVVWMCIIVLGRLIAYDHVWGAWSPAAG
jgi:uncharacterized protein DUF6644